MSIRCVDHGLSGRLGESHPWALLPEAIQQVPVPVVSTTRPTETTTETTTAETPTGPPVTERPDVDPGTPTEKLGIPLEKAERLTQSSPTRRVDDLRPEGLRLSATEREFLPRLGPLPPTPRSAKRLVNLYRLLRIAIPEAELPTFVGGEDSGPYQAAAILLATVIGVPADARLLLTALPDANPREDIITFLRNPNEDWHQLARLTDLIETIRKDIAIHGELASYQEWARTVAHFSFKTYDLFLSN